jgi:general secretion pathway protein C
MSSRWTGFFIWALVAASTAFWGIKIFAATRPVPAGAQAPQAVAANGPMERLFGAVVVTAAATPAQHPESERFQLVGVIAQPNGSESAGGVAIVSIDGQPARPWRIGATLDGNTTLLAVAKRTADFGPAGGPSAFSLQLPEPAAAETGTLAPAVSQSGGQPALAPAIQAQMAPQRGGVAPQSLPSTRGGFANVSGMPGRSGVVQPTTPGAFMRQAPGAVPPPRTATPADPGQSDGNPQQQ